LAPHDSSDLRLRAVVRRLRDEGGTPIFTSMDVPKHTLRIGTAGWSLPKAEQHHFPAVGTHLERYASRFAAVEINSSFHRSHKPAIWTRWRDAVPASFRFSVKIPKAITHTARLSVTRDVVAAFIEEVSVLEAKLGCLLVQLPPSLVYDARIARNFFEHLTAATAAPIACEPRHESWFMSEAATLLRNFDVARVAADPARVPSAGDPRGSRQLTYFRLHGSPKMYYSSYSNEYISRLADRLREEFTDARMVWCIFDNTTLGAATANALALSRALGL
jgi:uncharacterized protein YecE (DUF72 family)